MEPTYSSLASVFRLASWVGGHKTTRYGHHRLEPTGGAVVAINHTSYLDFTFAGVELRRTDKRFLRFMAKSELEKNPVIRFLMARTRTISVDRFAPAESYRVAVQALRDGELVGVYPEATINKSFELKEFKTGAARMALEADVPIVPVIVWGAQRIITKGQPAHLGRTKTPVMIASGEPLEPSGDPHELTARLRAAMNALLREVQDAYGEHPAGAYWVPARLGGGAPTLEEAERMAREQAAERAARKQDGG
ncbi:1-acyl-sn-glycerol-3-phosphate acyltransferase [soil metagenome]